MLLVVVLGIVAVLSLIGYTMSFSVRVHSRIADNSIREAQGRYLAEAAIEQAIATLMLGTTLADGADDPYRDPAYFQPTELGDGTFEVSYPDKTAETGVAYGIQDESAKLNLNTATRDQLLQLPGMTDSMADALIDWRDTDDLPGLFGAESDYYSALEDPYEARNAALGSIREMLAIRDFDETALYGEDANGNGVLDPNEDDGDASPPNDNADGVLDEGLLPYVTVYSADRNIRNDGRPRVNIQKASAEELLSALPGLGPDEAQAIVQYRGQHSFQSIVDLLDVTASGQTQGKTDRFRGSSRQGQGRGGARQSSSAVGSSGLQRGTLGRTDMSSSGLKRGTLTQTDMSSRSQRSQQNRSDQGASANQSAAEEETVVGGSSQGSSSDSGQPLFTTAQLRQWADAITVTDEAVLPGRINLNTAPPEILATLPGLTDDDITQIELLRAAGSAPFQSVGDLFQLPGMTESKFREVADLVTTRSFQFSVHAKGRLATERAQTQIESVLERDENGVHVLYWREY